MLTLVHEHAGAAGATWLKMPSSVLWTASGVAVAGGLNLGTFERRKLSLHSGLRFKLQRRTYYTHDSFHHCVYKSSQHAYAGIKTRGGAPPHAASQQHKYMLSSA